ncbi:MAG: methionyl-tRNA formyltransferase [Candidatus Dojkabacteria bacterium]
MKIILIGTDKFAIPSFKLLIQNSGKGNNPSEYSVPLIITQPDRPAGRSKQLTSPDVKTGLKSIAEVKNIKILQPEKIKDHVDEILEYNPELIFVCAYGQMIPTKLLDIPKLGAVNLHGSLLPKHRGAVPVEMAILCGDKETGVSLLQMTPGLDDGAVLAERAEQILPEDDAPILRERLSEKGAELLEQTLPKLLEGKLDPIPQEVLSKKLGRKVSYCYSTDLSRGKRELNPTAETTEQLLNKVRAFAASGAWLRVKRNSKETELIIYKARLTRNHTAPAGKIIWDKSKKILSLVCKDGEIELLEVQLAGKKRSAGRDYQFLDGSFFFT